MSGGAFIGAESDRPLDLGEPGITRTSENSIKVSHSSSDACAAYRLTAFVRANRRARQLASRRGITVSPVDRLRGYIIERIMCDFRLTSTNC
jgi:hypothetical protein